jgi:hypothetical protein
MRRKPQLHVQQKKKRVVLLWLLRLYVQRQLANAICIVPIFTDIYAYIHRYVQRQLANAMEVVGNDSSQTGTILFVLKLLTISIDNIQVSLETH